MKLLVAVLLLTTAAAAQKVDYTLDNSLCRERAKLTGDYIRSLGNPTPEYRWLLVCEAHVWRKLTEKLDLRSHAAFSSPDLKRIFINAAVFEVGASVEFDGNTWQEVIQHEVGHILCNCRDEKKAWKEGRAVMQKTLASSK